MKRVESTLGQIDPASRPVALSSDAQSLDVRRALLRQVPVLAVVAVLALLLRDRLTELDVARIGQAFATVRPEQWMLGLGLTAISFWALGQYDVVVHRMIGRDTDPRRAARTGMAAVALGQTLGMGTLTGSFVRWRMLPGLGLFDATKISAIVTFSFFTAWAVVLSCAVLSFGAAVPHAGAISVLVLFAALGFVIVSVLRPGPISRLPLPPAKAMGLILVFTVIDTCAAAGALWAMMPAEFALAPGPVIAAYLMALGAGLILSTPGGVGPFEIALLTLLPNVPDEPLLAAILAFRAVYYAVPAVIAGVMVLRPGTAPSGSAPARSALERVRPPHFPLVLEAALASAPRAEAALLRHGRFELLSNSRCWPTALVARSGQSLIMLGDPLAPDRGGDEVFPGLIDRAQATLRAPVIYKCGGRLAAQARRAGWLTLPIAREGYLDPSQYSPDGPRKRQLRRKLRKAKSAGIGIEVIAPGDPVPLPVHEMDDLAKDWARARGGERGFSMGTWDPSTLRHAMIVLARDSGGALCGFITLHVNQSEATLDLMRQCEMPPDGMMHLLVHHAVKACHDLDLSRFSLAAVPFGPRDDEPFLFTTLRGWLDRTSGAEGLRQFKSAYDPFWETLYIAAPSRAALVLGALDVMREITRDP
ncbi:phosphatidylglycerol lysyltransferase domain-containing protein [Maritimibacter dapengensis]|uniref:DUF2156 domain-containing protein n=1 Tax=Maritimibacter dapengensis TaxID=2836868 RepID=A0ABS6T1V1_9RHOB|nr:phosphatidylglycerol lysyltransferase domain-containing protein [Maritimibacter dapengensis]MBV7379197.1 DUF2156 domain-containing protein [Maritimibacter dapengensis]